MPPIARKTPAETVWFWLPFTDAGEPGQVAEAVDSVRLPIAGLPTQIDRPEGFSPTTGVIVALEQAGFGVHHHRRAAKSLHRLGGFSFRLIVEKVGQNQTLGRVGEDGGGYAPGA